MLAPSHYFKGRGGGSFDRSVWLLIQLQLGYKHKLKGFMVAEVQFGLLYCIGFRDNFMQY